MHHADGMSQTGELIGAAEAAARLQVDRSTVTRWAKKGKLVPATKLEHVNGALVFEVESVEALVSERTR